MKPRTGNREHTTKSSSCLQIVGGGGGGHFADKSVCLNRADGEMIMITIRTVFKSNLPTTH